MDNSRFFKITDVDAMPPFFMNVVSASDLWTFISSNGGLTAGRRNADGALFPYYTDDKITDSAEFTGSKTVIRVGGRVWEPFSVRSEGAFRLQRNLYKSREGNCVRFEETNLDLGLRFCWSWTSSTRYGFVREAVLENLGDAPAKLEILDGLQNIMPCGVPSGLQEGSSNLVDAYKRSELEPRSGLGMFALSAIIIDRAEPSEALRCNTVWAAGAGKALHLLSSGQIPAFRKGLPVKEEIDVKGERGAYLLVFSLTLGAGESREWSLVADVAQDAAAVVALNDALAAPDELLSKVKADAQASTAALVALVASADGVQNTADTARTARHFSNTMFNIMRGGVPMGEMPGRAGHDVDFGRNPLPLGFSRRHGDPTRPWNKFNINVSDPVTGKPVIDYEGNWRDLFQNWEALAVSFPEYLGGMIAKFLDCSTADGYNPYRVMRSGFDWETVDPKNPWSYIGYWGDHQVIYLLRLLEACEDRFPGALAQELDARDFVYADLPYTIKPYKEILRNPKSTIDFDADKSARLKAEMASGAPDAALLKYSDGKTVYGSLLEKVLVSLLAKLSNFIPGGGIWMNTQRPEWNDANNALVGGGVSMVTLCYIRRYLAFMKALLGSAPQDEYSLPEEVAEWLRATAVALVLSDSQQIMDALGEAATAYRSRLYASSFSGRREPLAKAELQDFFGLSLKVCDGCIRENRRSDSLYHSYNLVELEDGRFAGIRRLQEMLEGQVAVLSSGLLSPKEAVELLDALRHSALWREDQHSYILYPNRQLPGFMQKNVLPEDALQRSAILRRMVEEGDRRIVVRDSEGCCHFAGTFRNAGDLSAAMDAAGICGADRKPILDIFEEVFDHKAFTGRSGTFFAYEGLGSIYWHMVSKLLVAVQENYFAALDAGAPETAALAAYYREILEGTGIHKTPAEYGAFPTDAYSHTPWGKGAKQPGMTGQVKEDILARFGELGVRVRGGRVSFEPTLLDAREYLPDGTLEFSLCGARVRYVRDGGSGLILSAEDSRRLLRREISEITVHTK